MLPMFHLMAGLDFILGLFVSHFLAISLGSDPESHEKTFMTLSAVLCWMFCLLDIPLHKMIFHEFS